MENQDHTSLDQYYSNVDQVLEILAPLQETDILGMFYHRIYPDGTTLNITSNKEWTELYFDKLSANRYNKEDISNQCFGKAGINLWALAPENQIWRDAQYFGYGNGISIIQDFANFREHVGFYAEANNKAINNFYINNMSILKQFRVYFITQASDLITQAEQTRIQTSHCAYSKQHSQALTHKLTQEPKKHPIIKFATSSLTGKVLKNLKTQLPLQLSPQRSECLSLLVEGHSAKQIAKAMRLSPRTVEYYINLLKKELGCRTSKELIANYADEIHSFNDSLS